MIRTLVTAALVAGAAANGVGVPGWQPPVGVPGSWQPGWAPPVDTDFFCPLTGQKYPPPAGLAQLAVSLSKLASATYQCKGALYAVKDIANGILASANQHGNWYRALEEDHTAAASEARELSWAPPVMVSPCQQLAAALEAAKKACGVLAVGLEQFSQAICQPQTKAHGRVMTGAMGFSSFLSSWQPQPPTAAFQCQFRPDQIACVAQLAGKIAWILEGLKQAELFAANLAQQILALAQTPCFPPVSTGTWQPSWDGRYLADEKAAKPEAKDGAADGKLRGSVTDRDNRDGRENAKPVQIPDHMDDKKRTNKVGAPAPWWGQPPVGTGPWSPVPPPTNLPSCAARNCELGQLEGKLQATLLQICATIKQLGGAVSTDACFAQDP